MSTGLELIPIALALGGIAIAASPKETGRPEVRTMHTRLRDERLLDEALPAVGSPVDLGDGNRYAEIDGVLVAFSRRQDGVFTATFDTDVSEADARAALARIDDEYTRLLQVRTYERVLDHAAGEGLAVESERWEGEDVVLTLRVEE
jgi:hypothetical protein